VSPLAGAEVAVVRDDQILLIRREDDGVWALPGGLVEVGETLAQAAQRELWKETSVRALRGEVTAPFFDPADQDAFGDSPGPE
jgi:8-oxo-dGTP diphosphatase